MSDYVVFRPTFTKEEFEKVKAELAAGDATKILTEGHRESLDELKQRLHRLEAGYDWNTVDTPSRARHLEGLRHAIAEREAEERLRKNGVT